ncbi:cilia- and flagella-associated protein 73-like [Haliotis rubra]|uniref:cilia- and flagella-associated protein 73-like n=1 Tax=Haliotis rubra TaxID=36100 RepID=UPI001EE54298|nr:cilia- and flagella-associated protein 73-like [Haliotis rubra]
MAASGPYRLDLEQQKRNVFVTQLNDREDEDEISAFPVVKESGDKLIETGINTLQKTLLLKKDVEVEKVQADLEEKRYEFKKRMEACSQRQIHVQKKQQQMKDRVSKFEKFIQENEAKRRRALQKYQQEVRLRIQKTSEFDLLLQQLEDLKARHRFLKEQLVQYKKYEEYLLRVIDAMPEDYLPSSEDKLKGLMMRHRTLSESNKDLVNNLVAMEDELEHLKLKLDEMSQEHNKQKVSINSQLARLQEKQETKTDSNQEKELNFALSKGDLRKRRTQYGVILMAIDNIYEKCRKVIELPAEKMELDDKLHRIKDHLNDRQDVARMAHPDSSFVGSQAVESHKESRKGKKRVTLVINEVS